MKKIIPFLKNAMLIIGAIAAGWTVFVMYHNFISNQEMQLQNDEIIKENLVELKQTFGRQMDSVNSDLQGIKKQQSSLEESFRFYRNNVDRMSKEQMEQIILDAYRLGLNEGYKKKTGFTDFGSS